MSDDTSAVQRLSDLLEQADRMRSQVEELTAADVASTAVVPIDPGSVPAEVTRTQLAHVRAQAVKKTQEIQALQQQLRSELEAQMRAMNELVKPLTEQVRQLEEGIWTVNLYLGRDEEIVVLRDGDRAPADTPLTLRQAVLSMDEETAAMAADGGIDARHLRVFDDWVIRPDNLDQVLPEDKGVVVLVPRSRGRDYEDPWLNKQLSEANRWSYFLIRNGDWVARMRTDFVVGKHLIPTTDEFTGLFRTLRRNRETGQMETVDLIPGSPEWDKAAKAQDARQRHYMRVALILQGLVDRTTVFHPLPAAGLNLLHPDTYAEGRAVLIRDAEAQLTDGREDFYTWLARLNRDLRVGMRVMGAFNTEEFRRAGEEGRDGNHYYPNRRITPRARDSYSADKPTTGELYTLEGRTTLDGQAAFTFRFVRAERWMGTGYDAEMRAPKTKARCAVTPGDRFLLPFDLVTVEEMRYYLGSRRQRNAYAAMFPLLHAAIAAKEAEAEAESPFRELLAGAVAAETGVDVDEARAAIPALVDWWKLANKWHRPLVTAEDPATEAKAIRGIVTEFRARRDAANDADTHAEQQMVARLRAAHPDIMVIGRRRDGGYLAFAPQPRRHGGDVASQTMWTVERSTTKTGKTVKTREWVLPGNRMTSTRILFADDRWAAWDLFRDAAGDLTDDELDAAAAQLADEVPAELAAGYRRFGRRGDPRPVQLIGVAHDPRKQRFEVWFVDADEPAELAAGPSAAANNTVKVAYGRIKVAWRKTRDGVQLGWDRTDQDPPHVYWGDLQSTTSTPAEPWFYVWDGSSRAAATVLTDRVGQDVATRRAEAVTEHNAKVRKLREVGTAALWVVHRTQLAKAEAAAYDRFLEDYADPDLWEGHRKTLRLGDSGLHPHGRDVPSALRRALDEFTDTGRDLRGHTVASVIAACGLDASGVPADLLDLPVSEDPDAG